MTRGKHGDAVTSRRLDDAMERISTLEAELRDERQSRHSETTELRDQVRRAQGRLLSDVARLAAERVAAAKGDAEVRLRELEDMWVARMRVVVRAGLTGPEDPLWGDPQDVADASGLPTSDVVAMDPSAEGLNRGVRRMFINKGNRNRSLSALTEVAAQGDWLARREL